MSCLDYERKLKAKLRAAEEARDAAKSLLDYATTTAKYWMERSEQAEAALAEAWTVVRGWSKEAWPSIADAVKYLIACDVSLSKHIALNRTLDREKREAEAALAGLREAWDALQAKRRLPYAYDPDENTSAERARLSELLNALRAAGRPGGG